MGRERRRRKAISRISDVPLRSDIRACLVPRERAQEAKNSVHSRRFVHNARIVVIIMIDRSDRIVV